MIHKINNILQKYLGIKVIKTGNVSPFRNVFSKRKNIEITPPIYIEFVGVPGVGKTTLFKEIDFNMHPNLITSSKFLNYHSIKDKINSLDKNEVYQKLADYSFARISKSNYLHSDKLMLAAWSYYAISTDLEIVNSSSNHTIISDEGIFKNLRPSIYDLYKNDIELFKHLINNRAIVYCYASTEVIVNRIQNRINVHGNLLPQYKVDSYDELYNEIDGSLIKWDEFINYIKDYLPILRIDTEEDIYQNTLKIADFIRMLQG